jgi:hypothetical protein
MKYDFENCNNNSGNGIGIDGTASLGEGVSKLLNLTNLDINFK